jgi:hypothetical protein
MKKTILALALLGATAAQAGNAYSELSLGYVNTGMSTNPSIGRFSLGYQMSPNLAVEGSVLSTVAYGYGSYSNGRYPTVGTDAVAIYLKPSINVGKELTLFGRIGAVQGTTYVGYRSQTDTLRSFGAGAEFKVNSRWSLTADYATYGANMDGAYAGIKYNFK